MMPFLGDMLMSGAPHILVPGKGCALLSTIMPRSRWM